MGDVTYIRYNWGNFRQATPTTEAGIHATNIQSIDIPRERINSRNPGKIYKRRISWKKSSRIRRTVINSEPPSSSTVLQSPSHDIGSCQSSLALNVLEDSCFVPEARLFPVESIVAPPELLINANCIEFLSFRRFSRQSIPLSHSLLTQK